MIKKYIQETFAIVIVSILFAYIYNLISEKPLKLIAEVPKTVSNNTLDAVASKLSPNISTNKLEINNTSSLVKNNNQINKDSVKKINNENIKSLSIEEKQRIEVEQIKKSNSLEKENLQKTVTYEQVKDKINDSRFYYIDARNTDDYTKSHIGNAINIFPHSDDESKYMEKIFTLPRDKVFIIYCNGGTCDLSHKVAEDMINAGHKNIFIYVGGWEDWTKRGNK